mmetsp:Transcript_21029/g.68055  ORF Transcript_21029/g.68055 Transcript_21029/m.68055 type:complete len:233 (-) Transcript_21029:96-794(-)
MGAEEAEQTTVPIDSLTLHELGHQELDRIVKEIEQLYVSSKADFLPVALLKRHLPLELGYEDIDELEDAVHGTVEDLICAMPNLELLQMAEDGKWMFRVKEPPAEVLRRGPTLLTFRVTSTKDLFRVCLKAPGATMYIQENEFHIGADSERSIDTLYQHLSRAAYNLGEYVKYAELSEEHKMRIMETVMELQAMLDVEEPFVIELRDESGLSMIEPADGVVEAPLTQAPAPA